MLLTTHLKLSPYPTPASWLLPVILVPSIAGRPEYSLLTYFFFLLCTLAWESPEGGDLVSLVSGTIGRAVQQLQDVLAGPGGFFFILVI